MFADLAIIGNTVPHDQSLALKRPQFGPGAAVPGHLLTEAAGQAHVMA